MTVMEAVKQSGSMTFTQGGAIKLAQRMLIDGENVIYACTSNVAVAPIHGEIPQDWANIKGKKAGVLVITDKRVIFVHRVLGSGTTKQIALRDISSVDDLSSIFGLAKIRIVGLTEMFVVDTKRKITEGIQIALSTARL